MNKSPADVSKADEKILQEMLLSPALDQSRSQKLLKILSHPSWQGIGALLGLASLIVTIFLTLFVYQVTQEQQIAYMRAIENLVDYTGTPIPGAVIVNDGPATAQAVIIQIYFPFDITGCNVESEATIQTRAAQVIVKSNGCEVYYDYIYPRYSISITPEYDSSLNYASQIDFQSATRISISGLNVGFLEN